MTPLQSALDAIDAFCGPEPNTHKAMARGLMRGYDARWQDQDYRTVAVEQEFELPIYEMASGLEHDTFTVAGKIDVEAEDDGQRWIVDHKTTSMDIQDPNATFWRQLAIESQVDCYLLSQHLRGIHVNGAIWDAIMKPGIRPKAVSKKDREELFSNNSYCGFDVSETFTQLSLLPPHKETDELFEYRVARNCIDNPDRFFQRRTIFRMMHELEEYAGELWDLAQEVLHARETNRHTRNGGACMNYQTPCRFLGICSGYDNEDSDKWTRRKNVHEELETTTGDGRDVLTNSRLACFLACRRKHHYAYELGLEPVSAPRNDALYFGNIFHEALEVWWGHYKEA